MIDKVWETAKELVRTNNLDNGWVSVLDVYRHLGGNQKKMFITDYDTDQHLQVLCPLNDSRVLVYDLNTKVLSHIPNESVETFRKYFKDNVSKEDNEPLEIPESLVSLIGEDNFFLTPDSKEITL